MNELSLLNTLFDDANYGLSFPLLAANTRNLPAADVKETKDAYLLEMDLPGKTEKDISLDLKDRVLTVSVLPPEKKDEKKAAAEKEQYLLHERYSCSFTRRFSLPEDINSEAVTASFCNGVLTVTVPRKANVTSRKIAITAA